MKQFPNYRIGSNPDTEASTRAALEGLRLATRLGAHFEVEGVAGAAFSGLRAVGQGAL